MAQQDGDCRVMAHISRSFRPQPRGFWLMTNPANIPKGQNQSREILWLALVHVARLSTNQESDSHMHSKRLDIQGLRALAVLLVIANHLVGWPSGGFIGVDIFFVISGYLITGLLLREQHKSGAISLKGFYTRRVKRILPAAVTVLLTTVTLGYVLFPLSRAIGLIEDAGWSAIFVANWRFIATGTDYMHATDSISPLQHYWSLAVEEQFYLVWPLVLIVVFGLIHRRPRAVAVWIIGVLSVASLAWAIWDSAAHPTAAYFSTLTRVWELGAGALLAMLGTQLDLISRRVRATAGWLGLGVLIAGALLITENFPFPGPWAVVPVLGTVLVIASGTSSLGRLRLYPLTNRVSVYIGEISYSLYLWHLPVIVFVGTLLPQRGEKFILFASLLMLVLAVLSYHYVETPLRNSQWTLRNLKPPRLTELNLSHVGMPALVVVVILLGLGVVQSRVPLAQAVTQTSISALTEGRIDSAASNQRANEIAEALDAKVWPSLEPSIDALGPDSRAPEWVTDGCLGLEQNNALSPEQNALRCVYGDPESNKTIAVMGDSLAISYVPGIRAALSDGWRINIYTMSQCPAVNVSIKLGDGGAAPHCDEFRDWSLDQINEIKPDLVLLVSSPGAINRLASGAVGDAALEEWGDGTRRTFEALAGLRTISLDGPPPSHSLTECAIAGSTPASCVSSPVKEFVDVALQVRAIAADYPDVVVPSTILWFCNEGGLCPGFIGDAPTLVDGSHLSSRASEALAPLMRDLFSTYE